MLKSIRSDKFIDGLEIWIEQTLGRHYILPPTFDIAKCFNDSKNNLPLIFVLSAGSDPVADFKRFSVEKEMDK